MSSVAAARCVEPRWIKCIRVCPSSPRANPWREVGGARDIRAKNAGDKNDESLGSDVSRIRERTQERKGCASQSMEFFLLIR